MSVARTRLRHPRDIAAVLRGRRQRTGEFAVLHVLTGSSDHVRVGVIASRKVGSAVRRNRAKRVLREAARTVAWRPGSDVVLIARAAAASTPMSAVAAEVGALAAALGVTHTEVPA